jgi:hypothetical protein
MMFLLAHIDAHLNAQHRDYVSMEFFVSTTAQAG